MKEPISAAELVPAVLASFVKAVTDAQPPPPPPAPEPIRILLSEAASRRLDATGERAFTIVHRVMRTEEPGTAGRWAITLAPVEWQTARDASAVLMGKARAVKIKTPKP